VESAFGGWLFLIDPSTALRFAQDDAGRQIASLQRGHPQAVLEAATHRAVPGASNIKQKKTPCSARG